MVGKGATKAIVAQFEVELKIRVPGFRRVKGEPLPAGCRLFGWQYAPDLTFYLLLNIVNGERFFIDIAWTRNGRFPDIPLRRPRDIPELGLRKDEPMHGDFLFRLPMLWLPKDKSWDVVPKRSLEELARELESGEFDKRLSKSDAVEDLLPKVSELVHDAVEKVEGYAVPYLLQVAKDIGATATAGEKTRES